MKKLLAGLGISSFLPFWEGTVASVRTITFIFFGSDPMRVGCEGCLGGGPGAETISGAWLDSDEAFLRRRTGALGSLTLRLRVLGASVFVAELSALSELRMSEAFGFLPGFFRAGGCATASGLLAEEGGAAAGG